MITRKEAEQQAEQCFAYHAGAYGLTVLGLAVMGHRSTAAVAGVWGLGVLAHGVSLYGTSEGREWILRETAAGMENRQRMTHSAKSQASREPVMAH